MGVELPNSGQAHIPEVPAEIRTTSPALFDWAQNVRRTVQMAVNDMFSNDLHIATAINLGISGTFTISSGGSIVVTSGIVINVTS